MKRKLSQKERGEVVTKGFLEDYIDSKDFVTKDYLDQVLESKNYVTKNYLHQTLEETFSKYRQENRRHLEALMEDYHQRVYPLVELFDARFERIERKIGLV